MDATETTTADAPTTGGDDLVLRLTETALATVADLRDAEDDADGLALRVEVTGVRGTVGPCEPNAQLTYGRMQVTWE